MHVKKISLLVTRLSVAQFQRYSNKKISGSLLFQVVRLHASLSIGGFNSHLHIIAHNTNLNIITSDLQSFLTLNHAYPHGHKTVL